MIQDQVLWHTLVDLIDTYPVLKGDTKTQVCVIGGGFTGLSSAIHLAEKGYDVVLLEANQIGAGGSGRNVGLVNPGTWAKPDDLNKYLGDEQGEILTTALGNAPSLVFGMIDRFNIDAQDHRTGNLHMAHNAEGEADVDDRYQQLTRRGVDVEVLSGAKCHEYCGTTSIQKALLDKRAGTVNPYAYAVGLAKAAYQLNVNIFENTVVQQLNRVGDAWDVITSSGTVHADKVVIATNAYTEGEWTDILKTIYFVCYYQIASEPLVGEASDKILPYRNGSWDTRLALSSIRRDKDNRLLLGTVGLSENKESLYVAWANTMLKKYFPEYIDQIKWQYRWCGRFGFTTDHIMRIFEPAPGVVAATAFNGRGITTGTMLGKAFADYLHTDDRSVLPLPFKTIEESLISFRKMRATLYDTGIALYHAGQCLKIVV